MKTSCLHSFVFSIFVSAILPLSAVAQPIPSEKARFQAETIVEGLKNPWAAAFLPDGRILITEREGRLRVVENGALQPDPVSGIPEVWAKGQGGLLDVELHPDFKTNGWIYLSYSDPKPEGSMTKIIRGRLKENTFVDQEVIFEAPLSEYTTGGAHFGNRMEFDRKLNCVHTPLLDNNYYPKPPRRTRPIKTKSGTHPFSVSTPELALTWNGFSIYFSAAAVLGFTTL